MDKRTRRRTRALTVAALAAVAIAGAGCDDESDSAKPAATERRPAPEAESGSGRADTREVEVIRAWSEALRSGRERKAAGYFARPVLVQNGGAPLRLGTEPAVRLFNRALPCGALLLEARRSGRYTVATFRLTDRPGGDCGSGAGQKAATAFRFRGGKISEWRRAAVPGEPEPDPGPGPEAPPPVES
jgi:hypothetical protein